MININLNSQKILNADSSLKDMNENVEILDK